MFTMMSSQNFFGRSQKLHAGSVSPISKRRTLAPARYPVIYGVPPTRVDLDLDSVRSALAKMNGRRKLSGNNKQVFKGSALVSALLYTSPRRFKCRASSFKFARRLFRLGCIKSIFGWTTFEDSSHLYRWEEENVPTHGCSHSAIMSNSYYPPFYRGSLDGQPRYSDNVDQKLLDDVKGRLLNKDSGTSGYLIDSFFRDLEKNFPEECRKPTQKHNSNYWNNKRSSTTSTDSSADPYSQYKSRDKLYHKSLQFTPMASSRDHSAIPEEAPDTYIIGRLNMHMPPFEYDMSSNAPGTYNSHASSGAESGVGGDPMSRRLADQNFSFSDNEKQLLEEMKRMKKEHQHILRTYEDRINKLMMKMHELRSIAEMLENSSTKSSPYGIIPGKTGLHGTIDGKTDQERTWAGSTQDSDVPPPLPPRPSRGNKVYPNKPIVQPRRKMKYIPWKRIILSDLGTPGSQLSIWHTMAEPRIDADTVEQVFNNDGDDLQQQVSLYDDVVARRGRSRNHVSVVEREKAQIFINKIHFLKCTLQDVLTSISDLQTTFLEEDGSDALLDLVLSNKDMEKVLHQAQRKGAGQFDLPDFIMYEVSRLDHYREKSELLRFQQRIHDYLFDIDQQLKDVRTACEEICSSVYLKNLLETLLAIGNYMNGGTAAGQADGYSLEVLTNLKDTQDKERRENLLEFLIKTYCQQYTQNISRYALPEPANMRHAAQVSLEDVSCALSGLNEDLNHIKKKISPLFHENSRILSEIITERLKQFFVKAEDNIESQVKHFRETKDNFQRTAAYYMFPNETEQCCTKKFFQTWAGFLHDCKHYWKVVQRKLAKDRFQSGFKNTLDKKVPSRKLPLPDPPPEIPPKPVGNANVATTNKPLESSVKSGTERPQGDSYYPARTPRDYMEGTMSNSRHRENQQHPSERQARQDQDIRSPPSRKSLNQKQVSPNRSSSPKRMISTPPTAGDIHRPVPTPPKPSKVISNNLQVKSPNYENHEDAAAMQIPVVEKDSSPSRHTENEAAPSSPRREQIPIPNLDDAQKKANSFSLTSWLRKENPKPKSTNKDQVVSPRESEQQSKSNTAFVKLRNTVVHKFGNSGQSRKTSDSSSPESKNRSPVKDQTDHRHHSPNKYPQPYTDGPRGRSRSRSPSGERKQSRQPGHPDSDLEAEDEVAFYNGRGRTPRDKSPIKSGEAKTISQAMPPTIALKPQMEPNPNFQPFGSGEGTGNYAPPESTQQQSDMNNNEQTSSSKRHAQNKRTQGRNRAPIALGSNMSLSDPFPRSDVDPQHTAQRQSWDVTLSHNSNNSRSQRPHYHTIAGSEQVNPIPTYRAKIIHMYENQAKYDAAERRDIDNKVHNANTSPEQHKGTQQHKSGQERHDNYYLMQQKDGQYNYPQKQNNANQEGFDDRFQRQQRHGQTDYKRQEKGLTPMGPSYHGVNLAQPSQLKPSSKAAAHAQSITSLIERFEAGKGPPPPGYQGNPVAMTSTPVTHRKNAQLSLPPEPQGLSPQDGYPNTPRNIQSSHVQNPFPLLDAITKAASGPSRPQEETPRTASYKSGGEGRGDNRYHGEQVVRGGYHNQHNPQHSPYQQHHQQQNQQQHYPNQGYDSSAQRPQHQEDGGYKDQLRRVANTNTVLHRYSKPGPGYSGMVMASSQLSPPHPMRAMPVKPPPMYGQGVTV